MFHILSEKMDAPENSFVIISWTEDNIWAQIYMLQYSLETVRISFLCGLLSTSKPDRENQVQTQK